MYIKKLSVKNFKAVSEMELEFQPGINILIGDNGVGKTTILEAIIIAMGGFLSGIEGVSTKNILQSDMRISVQKLGGASTGIVVEGPALVACEADVEGQTYQWTRSRDIDTSSRTRMDDRKICKYVQRAMNDIRTVLPLISFQSEARVWQLHRKHFGKKLKKKLNDRRCGYIGCIDSFSDVQGIYEWCLKMELEAFQQNAKISEYEAFKDMVSFFMQKVSSLSVKPEVYYSKRWEQLMYRENVLDMPISYLSAGYQSLLWMVMDLAYRMALLNPQMGENIRFSPGVVVIDEIDIHLHPKWQWNIVNALQETFPKLQFILATHAPIVISSCKDAQLILLTEKDGVSYLPEAYGYSVQDVLAYRQGSMERPKEIQEITELFEEYLEDGEYQKARQIYDKLIQKLGEEHSDVKSAQEKLELYQWAEEQK